ncbi:MAG: lysophospholipid acyltransferase family protein [Desulfobacteraceae bacterium]
MPHTVFDAPLSKTIMKKISLLFLKCTGWQVTGELPDSPKCVIIAAPHTSNWDLPYTLSVAFALDMKIFWMGKASIFTPPFHRLFRWLGGIPIDRSKAHNTVEKSIETFEKSDELLLAIPPSGTRKQVATWKTGFYHIARGANVPIALGFLDYRTRTGGIGPLIHPTGDMDSDMKKIRQFYQNITGKISSPSIQ